MSSLSGKFVVTCTPHLEKLLVSELSRMGLICEAERGAVIVEGGLEQAYRVALWSRVAGRVLWPLKQYYCPTEGALYAGACKVRWKEVIKPGATIAVRFVGRSQAIRNTQFGALRIKDAICDTMLKFTNSRPDVDRFNPDLAIHVHLRHQRIALYVDLSGPLHQRGYRLKGGRAPMRETLAASLLEFVGYDGTTPLMDPMCGSGTLVLEAAMMAADFAPNLKRVHWGFHGFAQHKKSLWKQLLEEAHDRVKPITVPLIGSDDSKEQLKCAHNNAANLGLKGPVFECHDVEEVTAAGEAGVLVCNPPFGERIDDNSEESWKILGDTLKQKFAGWKVGLMGTPPALKNLGLATSKKQVFQNGPLRCVFATVEIYEGSRRDTWWNG